MTFADDLAAVRAETIRYEVFVKMALDAGDVRLCTGITDLTLAGETYAGDGTVHEISLSRAELNQLAGAFDMTLSGVTGPDAPDNGFSRALGLSADGIALQGRRCTVTVALVDDAGAAQTILTEVVGIIDTWERSLQGDEALLTIRIENGALHGRAVRPNRYGQPAHQALNSGATIMRQLPSLPELKWGAPT